MDEEMDDRGPIYLKLMIKELEPVEPGKFFVEEFNADEHTDYELRSWLYDMFDDIDDRAKNAIYYDSEGPTHKYIYQTYEPLKSFRRLLYNNEN
jgi:hypothetical protein